MITVNSSNFILRLTVNFCLTLRLTVKFKAILRLTLNPIETPYKVTKHFDIYFVGFLDVVDLDQISPPRTM